MDRASLERREAGGDNSSCVDSPSRDFGGSESFDFGLSSFFPKKVVKEGAAGFSFGVTGRWDDGGRVPMGAWIGLWGSNGASSCSNSVGRPRGRWPVEPTCIEGRRDWFRDHAFGDIQSCPELPALSEEGHPNG